MELKDKELQSFLEQFNSKYKDESSSAKQAEELRPVKAPDIAPCQWGFPCNNCGQC